MIIAAGIAIAVGMALLLVRAFLGPTIYDRILAINNFGTKAVLFIALYGYITGGAVFLDIALVYALFNFIVTIAVLKYFEYGNLGYSDDPEEEPR